VVIRTPDRRLRVFVSSIVGEHSELAAERRAVTRAISALRLTPVLFEEGARPHPPRELHRAYLAQSDVFIGLYWQRYGRAGPGMEISGLEEELQSCVPSCVAEPGLMNRPGDRRRLIGGEDAGSRRAGRRGPGPAARREPRPHDPRTGRGAPAPSTSRPVNSDHIRALRHARELVADMRWRGLTVPPLYDRMAGEFQDLVDSGDYANWVATGTAAAPPDRPGSLPSGSGELVSP
jgi:hypothetical protein